MSLPSVVEVLRLLIAAGSRSRNVSWFMWRANSFVCVAIAAACGACAGPGNYVWYSQLSPAAIAAANEYLVSVGDTLSVRVLGHEDMSTRVRVRSDGRVAVPIIGEVNAGGKRPSDLRTEIEGRLKEFLVLPSVTLNIDETLPPKITLLGEFARPGVFPVEPNTSLAEAIALGGGVTEFASRDRIFVVRSLPQATRIRFTWDAVTRDVGLAAAFPIRGGDVIVIE
jgi:polysaccharide export outer membrane protein